MTAYSARADMPVTKAARHARIIELLARAPVHSQSELVSLLADEGLSVTQATLSRDLDEIGALRLRERPVVSSTWCRLTATTT